MTTTATETTARTFAIDKAHSEVLFQVRHLVTRVRGRFTDFNGTITFDPAHADRSAIAFTVNAASVDTATADRDQHLRSDDFFAVEKFPQLGELGLDLAKLRWSQFHFSACVGDSHGVDSA